MVGTYPTLEFHHLVVETSIVALHYIAKLNFNFNYNFNLS